MGGRYRLVSVIAVGGMGEVWEAFDESLGRPVAVKVLRPEFAGDETLLARFRVEARNSAALSHPNIAPLFDYGEDAGTAYLVMELVRGEPLSDLLERRRTLPPAQLLPILSQAARGLHYAHQMGVVHRDVKPGNLIVEPSGRVRITDFGVSQAINQSPMTATGMVMGTAQYLSPEQAVGRPATRLSDLYALGIIAYEAVVGQRPFTGGTAVDIAIAQVNDPVPALPAAVDPRLAALVVRLLDKEPANRPQSGAELAELFDSLLARTPPAGNRLVADAAPGTDGPRSVAGSAPAPARVPVRRASAPTSGPVPPSFTPRSVAPRPAVAPGAAAGARPGTAVPADGGTRRGAPARAASSRPAAARPAAAQPAAALPASARPVAAQPAAARPERTGTPDRSAPDRTGPAAGGSRPQPTTRSAGAAPTGPRPAVRRSGPRWGRIGLVAVALLVLVLLLGLGVHALVAAPGPAPVGDGALLAGSTTWSVGTPIPSGATPAPGADDRGGLW